MLSNKVFVSALYVLWSTPRLVEAAAKFASAEAIASSYSLATSTSIPFPAATLANADAVNFIQDPTTNAWSLSKGAIQNNPNEIAFVNDPFPNSPTPGLAPINNSGPVLQVTYPQGSLHANGGTQLYSLWNTTDGSQFESMLLSYEVAFDSGFPWVKGGKLPGLRGGPDPDGCSGGSQPNGTDCFSTRMMWRTDGAGEVYAYIPTPNGLCAESSLICNDGGYGESIDRGSFSFASGQWNRITMLVQMNSPPDVANGNLVVFYNDVQALSQTGLQFRASDVITVGGLYLSTFFGGSDDTWAPPSTVNSYFRNFRMWGSSSASNLTGAEVTSAASPHGPSWLIGGMSVVLGATIFGL